MIVGTTTLGSPQAGLKQDVIDKAVVDTFDELLTEISVKTKLHCSEQVSREKRMSNWTNSKLYDFINSYHAFCKLCEQHFYTRSVANDINSFFQNHVNTSYHRQLRTAGLCSDDVPIFTWEQTLHSAKCNICQLSGLNAFVISTKFCIMNVIRQHVCVWPPEERETNEKFLGKVTLLKKYCGLRIFREKLIRTINGREVCLLCGVVLPWSGKKAVCHLKSDAHYQKFCMFIWMNFNFAPKDVLNGFNLETVTRCWIVHNPPEWKKFVDCNELAACLNDTNSCMNPYPEDKRNMSYSPAFVRMLLEDDEVDFIYKNECLLCNVELGPGHFSSPLHLGKVLGLSKNSFQPKKYDIYIQNRGKRLLPNADLICRYEKLGKELQDESSTPSVQAHPLKPLIAKKLALVDKVITTVDYAELFCQVCDQNLQKSCQQAHLDSYNHKSQVEKWKELRESFANERFAEPFKRIKNVIACLLCGAVITTNSFFSHLKGGMHARKMEFYASQDLGIPISCAFKFREDFSCCCTICNTLLSKKRSLKATLKEIKYHWPCPKAKNGRQKDLANKMEVTLQQDGGSAEATACEEGDSGDAEVEKTESVMAAFGETVTNSVPDKSVYLLKRMDTSQLVNSEVDAKRSATVQTPPTAATESVCGSDQLEEFSCCCASTCTCSGTATGNEDSEKEARREGTEAKVERKSGVRENDSKSEPKKKEQDEGNDEVLILEGVPKRKRKCEVIYSRFEAFGKIKYVLFDWKTVVVAFVERGIAGAAALEATNALQEPRLGVMVGERKFKKRKGKRAEKLFPLHEDLVNLLQEPKQLTDFLLCLVFQAVTASQSPVEAKREEAVCNMIIRAVIEKFPSCRCYSFGSRLTGLSFNSSDLDVFLDCGGMFEGFKCTTPSTEKNLVRSVAAALRNVKDVSDIVVVDNARVPIVSFLHKPTKLHCDISFKSSLSIQNSLLIRFLVSLDWRVKPLILFMKCWAKLNGLQGPPYFSSYALSMLVINYLEQLEPPVLPTIELLQSTYVGRRVTIGGWDCSINTNTSVLPKLDNRDSLPTLLAGLFEFYATFDFAKNVVFPLSGKSVPREAFSESGKGKLPMCFKRHIINVPVPIENLVSDKFPICVVDPFDLSHVLTKSFTSQGLLQFLHLCRMSSQNMKKGLTGSLPQEK